MNNEASRLAGAWMASLLLFGITLSSTAGAEPPSDVSDDAIVERVMERLNADRELGAHHIRASSRNGIVHLRGKVASAAAAKRAIVLAETTQGVRGVWVEFTAD